MAQGEAVSAPDDTRRTLADAALARAACATPAPWRVDDGEVIAADEPDVPSGYSARVVIVDRGDAADLDFIAHAREDVPALAAEVLRLRAERDALRAIIAGRTTPTEAEVEAHHAAGGAWLTVHPCSAGHTAMIRQRDVLLFAGGAVVCIALDRERRPCPWPEVAR